MLLHVMYQCSMMTDHPVYQHYETSCIYGLALIFVLAPTWYNNVTGIFT